MGPSSVDSPDCAIAGVRDGLAVFGAGVTIGRVFIGHYGVSLAGEAVLSSRLSLPVLFVAVQFLDVLFSLFVLAGIEKMRIVHGFTAFNPYDLFFMPYSHSLLGALVWSARSAPDSSSCRAAVSPSAPLARPGARWRRRSFPTSSSMSRAHSRPASSGLGRGLAEDRPGPLESPRRHDRRGARRPLRRRHDLPARHAPRQPGCPRRATAAFGIALVAATVATPFMPEPVRRPPPSPSRPSSSTRPWPWAPGTSTAAACRTPDGCLAPPAPLSRGASCAAAATTRRGE